MTVDAATSRKNQIAPSAFASVLLIAHRERAGRILQCVQLGGGGGVEQEKNLAEQVFSGFCFFRVIENKSKVKTQTWTKNGFHCSLLDKRLFKCCLF